MMHRLTYRKAEEKDLGLLAEWNHQLIQDEGHRNPMTVSQLCQRMQGWLEGEYQAVIFEAAGEAVAYGLYRQNQNTANLHQGAYEVYLRQFFVRRDRRRQGIGRQALRLFIEEIWPANSRLSVEVLTANEAVVHFWRAVGFRDYCLQMEILPDGEDRLPDG